jgi:hypothetical protein
MTPGWETSAAGKREVDTACSWVNRTKKLVFQKNVTTPRNAAAIAAHFRWETSLYYQPPFLPVHVFVPEQLVTVYGEFYGQ